MAKSPDPCSRQPKEKAASNNDDCLIGPTAPPDTKGSEMQQRKTQLLSLMDAFETPSGAKTAAATKSAPAPGSTAVAQVAAKKRDTTPAPPVSTAGAPATTTKPPLAGAPKFASDKHR
ncbi:glutaconyl-CoA decarboxylase subunit gamma domain protein [Ostertagia ostertagi]